MQLTNIDIIRNNFKIKNNYPLISNIAYTYQYVEYLSNKILFEHNTTVITKLLIKDYIINSISIIEALFYALLNPFYNFKHPVSLNFLLKNILKQKHVPMMASFLSFCRDSSRISMLSMPNVAIMEKMAT